MFIYNIKMNGSTLFKIILTIIICIVIVLCGIVGYRIYRESRYSDSIKSKEVYVLNNKNYATVLDTVHKDIDTYVGQKIKFSGFVYRVYDLDKEQFVLGRNMLISSDFQTVVVGFLCHY